ncbi:MAG: carbon storage regulator CsrA [Clostridiaceae bacterium]|jgi:carbon storage regulator|nr:carbon storage regulator CsrA [Clostridiaceae bacterium]
MLVLTRKKGQALMIGHDIELSVIDIQGDQVRIGITAPKNVPIHRKEIYEEIRKENLSAIAGKNTDIQVLNEKFKKKADNTAS